MLAIDGLASGIDTTAIIEGLLQIQQSRIDRLTGQQEIVQVQQTAFKGIEARLLSLRSDISQLSRSVNNAFESKSASSSNEDLVKASASEDALNGVYTIRVDSLARSHQVATQGYAGTDSVITQGTLDIQLGTGASASITIDSTNNTLQGLADAINSSSAEVSASIINDGSAGSPYRLMLTAEKTGAANTIAITNNLGATGGGATQPSFQISPPIQAAADAAITIGSGAGAITLNSATNQVENAIPGVTLDLLSADNTKDVTLTISNDIESVKSNIESFVDSFNEVMEYIDDTVSYDAEAGEASVLIGNNSVINIQDDVRRAVNEVVAGINSQANTLSAIGITFNSQGNLSVNSGKLDDALNERLDGVDLNDVRRLFALDGQSTNGNIEFILADSDTKETATGYQVDITAAAERGAITATNALAASTVIDGSNNTLTLTVDGKASSTLTLTAGTYTRQELADHLESLIEADSELAGRSVSVGLDSDKLTLTSELYGIASEITIGGGTSLAILGLAGTESDFGQDVAGKFIVNGIDETAVGTGRLLVGDENNANTAGLQVDVGMTSSQVQAGVDGTLTITRGLASRLDQVLDSMLDPVTGRVKTVSDGFTQEFDDIQDTIDRQQVLFELQQQRMIDQFVALESAISDLQATGNFLATQLAGLQSFNASRN